MIQRYMSRNPITNYIFIGCIILISATCFALALNMFYIPGNIYGGGVNGLAQLITYFFNNRTSFEFPMQTGTLYFLINVPLLLLSFKELGVHFTFFTLAVVGSSTIMTHIVPIQAISNEPLLNAIIGGALSGTAVGLAVKHGMSTGGTDIISMIIFRSTGVNVGSLNFMMNSIIIIAAGLLYGMEYALFTIIAMFVSAMVINAIHTNEERLTVFIITSKVDQVLDAVFSSVHRGVTVLDGVGGYSRKPRNIIMIVVNRYELYELKIAVSKADPRAFIDIVKSQQVVGNFLRREQQPEVPRDTRQYHSFKGDTYD